tara:strand:+ start:3809 stop:5371 length:1563 start_codon:yes stop_codon:yes gene_type:complete
MGFTTTIPTVQREENSTVSDTAIITISSNDGYLYTASDFKITNATEQSTNKYVGGDLPIEISDVTFTDNTDETVNATITFSGFPMTGDKDFRVPIESKLKDTNYVRKNYACIKARYTTSSDHTVTVTPRTATVSASTSGSLTIQQIHANVYHADHAAKQGMQTSDNLLALITFTADSGKFYSITPAPELFTREYNDYWNIAIQSRTYDSSKRLTQIIYEIRYDVPDQSVLQDGYTSSLATCALNHFVNFNYEISTAVTREDAVKINRLSIDTKNISSNGCSRLIFLQGNNGAGGKLHIRNKDGKYLSYGEEIPDAGTTSGIISYSHEVNPISFSFTSTKKNCVYSFIAPRTTSDDDYHIYVEPNDGTILDSSIPTVNSPIRIYQFKPVTITTKVATASHGASLTLSNNLVCIGNSNDEPFLRNRKQCLFTITPAAEKTIKITRDIRPSDYQTTFTSRIEPGDFNPIDETTGVGRGDIRLIRLDAYLEGRQLKVLADVNVRNFGYEDVTLQINLDNFITVN